MSTTNSQKQTRPKMTHMVSVSALFQNTRHWTIPSRRTLRKQFLAMMDFIEQMLVAAYIYIRLHPLHR